jgi:TrmH family RNA methyltransferase
VSELADEWVKIPMENSLESLNVAVAHGILSYQIAQMRK